MIAPAKPSRLEVSTAEEAIRLLRRDADDCGCAERVANLCGVKRLSARGLA